MKDEDIAMNSRPMSNIDKQALNQEKIEWLNKLADMEYCKSNPGHWLMSLKDTNTLAKLALRSVALLDELEAKDKRIAELEALARGVKQFSEFQICHYGATEDYAKGYIDCQNNYNKVLFAAAGKGEAS
ncbi:hypothetical protein [Enterobacter rongchengensis]|uniref:hypothetical protein n=1 Tax=Enterobacter rongchengensis TaxID=3030999 RepID=UPI003B26B106